jgi:hypothetical protein
MWYTKKEIKRNSSKKPLLKLYAVTAVKEHLYGSGMGTKYNIS